MHAIPGAGFFIGDGAGVGKGRQIAGIILDNYARGRRRAVWLSTSTVSQDFYPTLLFPSGPARLLAKQGSHLKFQWKLLHLCREYFHLLKRRSNLLLNGLPDRVPHCRICITMQLGI